MDEPSSMHASTDEAVGRAKSALEQGRLAAAQSEARAVLARDPAHDGALYILAVAQRYDGALEEALTTVERLGNVSPGYGRADQERGHILLALGRADEARQAFDRAVAANPALLASWRALVALNADAPLELIRVQEEVDYLVALPPALLSVASMIYEGKLAAAEQICRRFLQANPTHIEGMRLLADIGKRLHVYDDAEFLLESALKLNPDYALARLDYVDVLHKRQKFEAAYVEAQRLREIAPDHPLFRSTLANQCAAVGRFEEALALYDQLERDGAGSPAMDLARGHALKTIGRQDDAIAAYRAACLGRPEFGDAWWSLANLKTYRFSNEEIAAMTATVGRRDVSEDDHVHLHFALGKAHEDQDAHETAFRHYAQGNAIRRQQTRYDADAMASAFAAQKARFTPDFLAARNGWGDPSTAPIFIVGLPRAGSTLVEQILASHPLVDGTLELPNILALVHRLNGRRRLDETPLYPDCLRDLPPEKFAGFGAEYLRETTVHRAGAPYFTDKMPNNFRHLGLIHLMLPNARVIDARRHAIDCCFSGWKQLFAEGQEFTYDLSDIGRYYRGYVDLMNHWERVLPGKILRVQYEDTIADLEGQVRRILDHCSLPFEQACIDFHRTSRAVRTASSEQVRQKIYRSGLDQWIPFRPWLGPLMAELEPLAR